MVQNGCKEVHVLKYLAEPVQSVFSDYLLFIDPGVLFNYLDRVCGQGHQLFQNFVRAAQNRIDY